MKRSIQKKITILSCALLLSLFAENSSLAQKQSKKKKNKESQIANNDASAAELAALLGISSAEKKVAPSEKTDSSFAVAGPKNKISEATENTVMKKEIQDSIKPETLLNQFPSKETSEVSQLDAQNKWFFMTAIVMLIGLGVLYLKKTKGNKFLFGNEEKPLKNLASLSLGPKRSIFLLDVMGENILVSSCDKGIQFLSKVGQPATKVQKNLSESTEMLPQTTEVNAQRQKLSSAPSSPAEQLLRNFAMEDEIEKPNVKIKSISSESKTLVKEPLSEREQVAQEFTQFMVQAQKERSEITKPEHISDNEKLRWLNAI